MENVSQALIIAAGVLIGIVILSMGVYLFSQAAALPKNYNDKLEAERLISFNQGFETYNKESLSAQDIVTAINLALENNRKYDVSETEYYVTIYLDGREMTNISSDELQKTEIDLLKDTQIEEINNELHISYPYKCEEIKYSDVTGRVISMKFEKII